MRSEKAGPSLLAQLIARLEGKTLLQPTPGEVKTPGGIIIPAQAGVGRIGEVPAELKGHNIREVFKSMFGEAFEMQTGRPASEVGLRGRLWVNPKTGRLGTPADGLTPDEIKKAPYLSWFQEDEAKYAVPESTYHRIDEALREASRTGDLKLIVGDLLGQQLMDKGFILEKIVEDASGRQFRDGYYDDKDGTCARMGVTIRFRQVADEIGTDKGRFTAKILGPRRGAIWSRGEVKFTAGKDFPEKKFLVDGALPDEINPVAYLRKLYNFGSLAESVIIADERHEFVLKEKGAKDSLYLNTLDAVTATSPDGAKQGHFYELEMERTVGSDHPSDQAAQQQYGEAFARRFGLQASTMTKAQNGVASLQSTSAVDQASAEPPHIGPIIAEWAQDVSRGKFETAQEAYEAAKEAAERARPNVQRLRDPFQRIVDGNRANENVVFENDRFMVIEDKFGGGGHTLVLPKELKNFPTDLTAAEQRELEAISAAVAKAFGDLELSSKAPGVWVNPPSALTVQRLHVHIAPSAKMSSEDWIRLGAEISKKLEA